VACSCSRRRRPKYTSVWRKAQFGESAAVALPLSFTQIVLLDIVFSTSRALAGEFGVNSSVGRATEVIEAQKILAKQPEE